MKNTILVKTPLGDLTVSEEDGAIIEVKFGNFPPFSEETPLLCEAKKQFDEYFRGMRRTFDLPLCPKGTSFQQAVWRELRKIPYGKTATYGEIAAKIGNPRASRAVGMANNKNPIGIIIPCHRVIGAQGKLVGYAGGLDKKEFLLALESAK